MVLKVFDEQTVAALDEFTKRTGYNVNDTRKFIQLIMQLWKILSVTRHFKGKRLSDALCELITAVDDPKVMWLKSLMVY